MVELLLGSSEFRFLVEDQHIKRFIIMSCPPDSTRNPAGKAGMAERITVVLYQIAHISGTNRIKAPK